MPVEEIADIVIAPTGTVAIIVGYWGIHRLDLTTMSADILLVDNRTERRAVISRDGTRAAVYDGYGPTLHVFDLVAGAHESRGGKKKGLKAQMKGIGRAWRASPDGEVTAREQIPCLDGVELRTPGGRFRSTRAVGRAPDGRVFVAGQARLDPRSEEPALALCVYDAHGDWLGAVRLAKRESSASHVFVNGQIMSVEALARQGITVSRQVSGEARSALNRFTPTASDGRREVVFGRLANGVLGRLDVEAPLGDRAFDHEQPSWIRPGLLAQPLPRGALLETAEDSASRFTFWAERVRSPKDLELAFEASARITHLMPELAHRLEGLTRKAWRRGLQRAGKDLRAMRGAQADGVFEAMCARVEREAVAAEIAALTRAQEAALLHRARDDLDALERVLAACSGAAQLDLSETGAAGLASLVAGGLKHVERLSLAKNDLNGAAAEAPFEAIWPALSDLDLSDNPLEQWVPGVELPALQMLDLRGTRLTDTAAIALAGCRRLPRLKTVRLPSTVGPIGRAALHLSPWVPVELPGAHGEVAGELLRRDDLTPRTRTGILRRLMATPDGHLCLDTARLDLSIEALVGRLSLSGVCAVELRGVTLTAAMVEVLCAEPLDRLTLVTCQIELDAAIALVEGAEIGQLVFDACASAPLTRIVLAAAGHMPPAPADVQASADLIALEGDAAWRHVIDASRRVAPEVLGAALTQPDKLAEACAGRPARVEWMLAWPEAGWSGVLGALIHKHAQATGDWSAEWGGATVSVRDGVWQMHGKYAAQFTLGPEPRMAAVTRIFSGQDVLTGDAEFDALARISGDDPTVLQALDPAARAVLRRALPLGVRYENGRFEGPWPIEADTLGALVRVHARWQWLHPELSRALARLADEPVGGARARLIESVLASRALEPEARAALLERHALDAHEEVRTQIAEALWRDHQSTPLAHLTVAAVAALLDRFDVSTRIEGVRRLAAEGDERCIPALTRVGTGLLVNRGVRTEARAAIEAITTRLGGLRSGGLSISEQADGGLSVSGDDSGT